MQRLTLFFFLAAGIILVTVLIVKQQSQKQDTGRFHQQVKTITPTPNTSFPLSIAAMRAKDYPGSDLVIEQTLSPGPNYSRFIAFYHSDGLKIYGLLTVPTGAKPSGGWPVILINHGYIPPKEYSTITSYSAVVSAFAASGFITFKPDYRGNGNSEGQPTQVYVSPDYVTDSMNALATIKKYKDANPKKIGIWAHSMGGNIALHQLVLPVDVQAVNIWSGVVGNYTNILSWWDKRVATGILTTQNDQQTANRVNEFRQAHGTPHSNPAFWNAIDPTKFLSAVNVPMLIQVGTADTVVPEDFSTSLDTSLKDLGKDVQLTTYPGADHNLVPDSAFAYAASLAFFTKHLR
jgi:dipeptidyl aminopeptidase/acylaminoacyl peptidase